MCGPTGRYSIVPFLRTVKTMHTRDLDALRVDALALAEQERAQLARDLVASLDGPAESDVAAAWDLELCRRINEIEHGEATLLDPAEVLTRARERIRNI